MMTDLLRLGTFVAIVLFGASVADSTLKSKFRRAEDKEFVSHKKSMTHFDNLGKQ